MNIDELIESWKWIEAKHPDKWEDFQLSDIQQLYAALQEQQKLNSRLQEMLDRATKRGLEAEAKIEEYDGSD